MACMCGDLGCRSCGPAQGSPCCEWSKERCGDPECQCAESTRHYNPDARDWDKLRDQLIEEAMLAAEWEANQ